MDNPQIQQDLAYDLRQRYAKLVGDHIEDVAIARKNRNYSEYFRSLDDLYTITKHKFKAKTSKEKKITYGDLRKKAIDIGNEYHDAWNGNNSDSEAIAKIENALRNMEMFIYARMDDAKMFGSKRDTEGLI